MKISVNLHTQLAAVIHPAKGPALHVRNQIPSGLRVYAATRRQTVLKIDGQLILLVKTLAPPILTESLVDLT